MTIARGSVRLGFTTSPDAYVACCQPPVDQSTPTIAVASPVPRPPGMRVGRERERRRAARAEREADGDQRRDARDLQHGEDVREDRTGFHAEHVDRCQQQEARDGHGFRAGLAQRHEESEVGGEGHAEGAQPARVDHEEVGPAEQEADQAAVGLGQVDVFAPGARHERGEFGECQRARHGHEAADHPHRHDQPGGRQGVRDQRRREEDAGADGAPDGNHRHVEQGQAPTQLGHGGMSLHQSPQCLAPIDRVMPLTRRSFLLACVAPWPLVGRGEARATDANRERAATIEQAVISLTNDVRAGRRLAPLDRRSPWRQSPGATARTC